jgi:hypothetical protein
MLIERMRTRLVAERASFMEPCLPRSGYLATTQEVARAGVRRRGNLLNASCPRVVIETVASQRFISAAHQRLVERVIQTGPQRSAFQAAGKPDRAIRAIRAD